MEKFRKELTRWPEENYAKYRRYGWSQVRDSNTGLPHHEAELLFIHSIKIQDNEHSGYFLSDKQKKKTFCLCCLYLPPFNFWTS